LTTRGPNVKNAKLGQKGREGLRDLLLKLLDPLHISGTVWARNFKFGMIIKHKKP